MWISLTIAFAFLCLILALRLTTIVRMLKKLSESVRLREAVLLERRSGLGSVHLIEDLQDEVNALIGETRSSRDRNRDYLRQIETSLGSIREAILIVDESGYVCMANDAAKALFGTDKHLLGRRVEGLVPSVAFLDYMQGVREGTRSGSEVVEMDRGGEHMWFEVTGSPVHGSESRRGLCLFVLHDITKLKDLERMRTEFVANVSHELRTPVTVIRGFTDMLMEEGEQIDPAERQNFLVKIQRNVVRLNSLLNDLLSLSRLEGRRSILEPEMLQINDVVREACENFADRKPKDCELEMALDPRIPVMALDPLRISQVLENLMDNAARHARGMKHLCVRTLLSGEMLRCSVEDDGCGIPEGDVPHLFERFYRVDKGRSRESGGTGLGLAIVKHIILQHGGRVFVESSLGRGTVMGFEIPLAGPPRERE